MKKNVEKNQEITNDLNTSLSELKISKNQDPQPTPAIADKTTAPIQNPVKTLTLIADIISSPSKYIKPSSEEGLKSNLPLQAKGWTPEKFQGSIDEDLKNITEHENMIKCYNTIISYMNGTITLDQLTKVRNDSSKEIGEVVDTVIAGQANIAKYPLPLKMEAQQKLQASIENAKTISNFAINLSIHNLGKIEQHLQQYHDNINDKSNDCSQFGSDEEINLNIADSTISNISSTIQDLNIDHNLDLTGNSSDI